MMPVVAAMIVPSRVTESASPPGTRRISTWRQLSRSRAVPERSSTVPMRMNIGIAVRIRFSAMPPNTRDGTEPNCGQSNRNGSMRMASNANAMPTPPSTKATG